MTELRGAAPGSEPAYRIDGRLADRDAFYAAACDPKRSVVVEACAGAGKTWMLVSRILRALLDGAEPSSILAITFTRKAAGEMRERLNDWLREFASPSCSHEQRMAELRARGLGPQEAIRLADALGGLHREMLSARQAVEVRTFHGWFSQLLRAAPMELLSELGLSAQMVLVEDWAEHEAAIFRRFHQAVLRDAGLMADLQQQTLRRGRSSVRKWLLAAWNKRVEIELADAAGILDEGVAPPARLWPDFAGLAHPAERLQAPVVAQSLRALASALAAQTGAIPKKQGAVLLQALEVAEPCACLDAVRAALYTTEGTLRKKLEVEPLGLAVAHLGDILAACDQHEAHEEHLRMARLVRCLLHTFAEHKRAHRLADMADLERCALHLLRDAALSGWVQERLDARIRHVLIDEFQDTSPLQWQALHAWLASYAGAGGGASGQRGLSVFIVGDPKQSIYRFRRAEPRVFEAARAFVREGLDGRVLACDHTRRNAPEILQAVNAVFKAAQAAGEFEGFRAHTTEIGSSAGAGLRHLPRVPRPTSAEEVEADTGADARWRDTLSVPRSLPEEALKQQEARRVAQAIAEMVRNGLAPGDIKVLSRRRAPLKRLSRELQALQLPHAAADARPLMESIEVRDLLAVLDALTSRHHRLSLAHALRSPIFSASDDDLIALAQAAKAPSADGGGGTASDWWQALQRLPDPSPALARARRLLTQWQADADALPPHDLLDRIVHEAQVHERMAAAAPASQRQAAGDAIDALLWQALQLDGARFATPYAFVRALRRRALQVATPVRPDAVQLLTVHGAKGLEAEAVFVMDTDPEPQKPDTVTVLVEWPVEAEAPTVCAFVYSESRCPPSLQSLLARERAARQREELNGLYVAMTRARRQLVFSATEPHRVSPVASGWQRLLPHALVWEPTVPPPAAPPALGAEAAEAVPPIERLELPPWAPSGQEKKEAPPTSSPAARLGEAVHRLLEWASPVSCTPGRVANETDWRAWRDAAAREHGADPAEVERIAGTILRSPACARFFDAGSWEWAGNEVPVSVDGQVQRIDRLVMFRDAATGQATWWVLDHKLHPAPDTVPAYRAQLLAYRRAVAQAQPADTVQAAFITGEGHCLPIDADS